MFSFIAKMYCISKKVLANFLLVGVLAGLVANSLSASNNFNFDAKRNIDGIFSFVFNPLGWGVSLKAGIHNKKYGKKVLANFLLVGVLAGLVANSLSASNNFNFDAKRNIDGIFSFVFNPLGWGVSLKAGIHNKKYGFIEIASSFPGYFQADNLIEKLPLAGISDKDLDENRTLAASVIVSNYSLKNLANAGLDTIYYKNVLPLLIKGLDVSLDKSKTVAELREGANNSNLITNLFSVSDDSSDNSKISELLAESFEGTFNHVYGFTQTSFLFGGVVNIKTLRNFYVSLGCYYNLSKINVKSKYNININLNTTISSSKKISLLRETEMKPREFAPYLGFTFLPPALNFSKGRVINFRFDIGILFQGKFSIKDKKTEYKNTDLLKDWEKESIKPFDKHDIIAKNLLDKKVNRNFIRFMPVINFGGAIIL